MWLNHSRSLEERWEGLHEELHEWIVIVVVDNNDVLVLVVVTLLTNNITISLIQRLDREQLVVSQEKSRNQQRNTQADGSNTHLSLNLSVSHGNGSSWSRTPCVLLVPTNRVSICIGSHGSVDTQVLHLANNGIVHKLGPDGTRDTVSDSRTNVVSSQVKGKDNSHVLVVSTSLDGKLSSVSEETSTETHNTESTNNTVLDSLGVETVIGTPVVVKKTGSKEPSGTTEDNERLGSSDKHEHETEQRTNNDRNEGVQGGDSAGSLVRSVHTNNQDSVHVVVWQSPNKVDQQGNDKRCPDTTVPEKLERNDWELGKLQFPDDKEWDEDNTNDQWHNGRGLLPSALLTTSKSERNQDETEDTNDEENTNNIENPEQVSKLPADPLGGAPNLSGPSLVETHGSVAGRLLNVSTVESVVLDTVVFLLLANLDPLRGATSQDSHVDQTKQEWDRCQWEDESPHTNTEVPGVLTVEVGNDLTTNPGVDDKWQSWNEGSKQSPVQVGQIGQEDLQHKDDTGVTNLVKHRATSETLNIKSLGGNDGTNGVEKDGDNHQFNTAEGIGHSGVGWLRCSGNHSLDNIDSRKKRVLGVGRLGIGLQNVSDSTVQTVCVSHKEHGEVGKTDPEGTFVLGAQDLRFSNTKGLGGRVEDLQLDGVMSLDRVSVLVAQVLVLIAQVFVLVAQALGLVTQVLRLVTGVNVLGLDSVHDADER